MSFQEKQADFIYNAVKKASVSPIKVEKGDLIVITAADNDVIGTVDSLITERSKINIFLKTQAGIQSYLVDDTNFVHIIQKVSMLNLKKHEDYERDNEVDMIAKNKGKNKERPEFIDEKSDKSNLPTSKISLSLRKTKKEA